MLETLKKFGLLSVLYFSQGLPFGFFTQALPVLLRKEEVSLPLIGFSSFLALPWGVKFLWAPLLDRYYHPRFGRRRSWLVPLQLLSALLLASLALADPGSAILWLVVGTLLTNFLAATQDVATDGLAVSLLDDHERCFGNGIQVGGYRVGMIVGGFGLLYVFYVAGWRPPFLIMAVLLGLSTIPVLLFRERDAFVEESRVRVRDFFDLFRAPGMGLWIGAIFLFKFGDSFSSGMLKPYLVDQGFEIDEIATLLGGVGFVTGLVGALAGGALVPFVGRTRALLVFGVLEALALAFYAVPASGVGGRLTLYLAVGIEHLSGGMATVALFTMMMDRSRPSVGGSDYTLQASVVVISSGIAAGLSGISAENIGYSAHFLLAGVLAALVLPFMVYAARGSEEASRGGN
ncbi:MAG: MFS transporter [Myxococcota bacterium]